MSDLAFSYSMGFSASEKAELLALVTSSPKWVKRVSEAHGCPVSPINLPPLVDHFAHWNTPPHPGWVLTNRDRSYYHTSGIYRWVPAGDPAAEPVRIGEVGHEGISRDFSRPVNPLPVAPVSALKTGERYQVDPWGKTYHLVNNGDMPSGIRYL